MVLTYIKNILSRSNLKILIIGAATGAILQFGARIYLKKHPELSNDKPVIKKDYTRPRLPSPRGGALIEIT